MGGYKKHAPTVYVVRWPDGVIKVGYSEKQRWRKFALLGADVLELFEFESHVDAFAFESLGHSWLARHGAYAFDSVDDSRAHVGPAGDGYAECFITAAPFDAGRLLEHMREHRSSMCLGGA